MPPSPIFSTIRSLPTTLPTMRSVSVRGDDSIAKGPSSGPILAVFLLPGPCG
jgi:hypothetical protein